MSKGNKHLNFFFVKKKTKKKKKIIKLQSFPDCLRIIFNQLKHDRSTLYSCIQVNRLWCRVAMPYLWYHPFGHPNPKGDLLIRTLLSCLPQNEIQILSETRVLKLIKFPVKPRTPLFNYPKFIICFNSENFIKFVKQLFTTNITLILQLIGSMIFHHSKRLKALELHFDNRNNNQSDYRLVDDINSSIKFQESLTKLTRLEIQIYINEYTTFIINLFNKISSSCNNIRHLSLIIYKGKHKFHQSFDTAISSLIKSQIGLESLVLNEYCLSCENTSIYDAISSAHSNSLRYLGYCVMDDYSLLMKMISTCKGLEVLEVNQQGNNEKAFNMGDETNAHQVSIKHFYCRNIIGNEKFIKTILKMSSRNLKSFSSRYISEDIIDTMEHYCSNLSQLNISMNSNCILNLIQIISGLELLENFTLELDDGWPKNQDERLQSLANILPGSLTYLGLNFYINPNQLNLFLKECTKPNLHTLELMHFHRENLDHLKIVVDYSKKFSNLKQVKFKKGIYDLGSDRIQMMEKLYGINVEEDLKIFKENHPELFTDYLSKGQREKVVETGNLTVSEIIPFNFSYYDLIFNGSL